MAMVELKEKEKSGSDRLFYDYAEDRHCYHNITLEAWIVPFSSAEHSGRVVRV